MNTITYKRHPEDGDINYIGVGPNSEIVFDMYLVGGDLNWVDVYNQQGKWKGKKIAEFKLKK